MRRPPKTAAQEHLRKRDDQQKILREFFRDERDIERRRLEALESAKNQVQDPDALRDLDRQIAAIDTSAVEIDRKMALLDSQAMQVPALSESQVKRLESEVEVLRNELSRLNAQRTQLDAEFASVQKELNDLQTKLRAAPPPQSAK